MPPVNGALIRTTRIAKRWKVGELADRAGVKKQHLKNLECGYGVASVETAGLIADALNLDAEELWLVQKQDSTDAAAQATT